MPKQTYHVKYKYMGKTYRTSVKADSKEQAIAAAQKAAKK